MEPVGKRVRSVFLASLFSSIFRGFLAALGSAARSKALQDCKTKTNPGLRPLPWAGVEQLKACPLPPQTPAQNSEQTQGRRQAFGLLGLVLTGVVLETAVRPLATPHTGPFPLILTGKDCGGLVAWSPTSVFFGGMRARVCVCVCVCV